MIYTARKSSAARAIRSAGVDAMLVTHLPDVHYLCGFTGSNAVLIVYAGKRGAVLFTDGRYTRQAKAEAVGTKVVIAKKSALREAIETVAASGVATCGFDAGNVTVSVLDLLRKALPSAKRTMLKPVGPIIAGLREVKDAGEIAKMKAAATLGCSLFEHILGYVEYGMREIDVAAELEHEARLRGAEGMSFETIVASGVRSALPHGHATTAKLPRNGFITLDFGVMLNGYCSDMTRTFYMGKASAAERDAYAAVLEAQQAGVAIVKPGILCEEVDEACRSVLRQAGLAKWFTHSTGHGVGLEIHEGPRLAAGIKQKLQPGMMITVEPGVYGLRSAGLKGKDKGSEFGIRIEDMVLVTAKGGEAITAASPKAWTTL